MAQLNPFIAVGDLSHLSHRPPWATLVTQTINKCIIDLVLTYQWNTFLDQINQNMCWFHFRLETKPILLMFDPRNPYFSFVYNFGHLNMVSNWRFTVHETLNATYGDSASEMKEAASGLDSQSDSDNEINMESASKVKWRMATMILTQTCQPMRKVCCKHEELHVVNCPWVRNNVGGLRGYWFVWVYMASSQMRLLNWFQVKQTGMQNSI